MNRRLYRSRTDSVIGGVAGGVAEYLDERTHGDHDSFSMGAMGAGAGAMMGGGRRAEGMGGNDTLRGKDGSDALKGGGGNDEISGGGGSDLLYGGTGDDFLNGNGGTDGCRPGSGRDTERNCEGSIVGKQRT